MKDYPTVNPEDITHEDRMYVLSRILDRVIEICEEQLENTNNVVQFSDYKR